MNVAEICVDPKLNHAADAALSKKQKEAAKLDAQCKSKNKQNLICLVFETEVCIASGGSQISELITPPPGKGTVHLGGSTLKIPIGTVVKVSADLPSGKREHGGRDIVSQVYGEVRYAKFFVKYNKLASSVGTESDVPLPQIIFIPDPYFYLSKWGGIDRVEQKPDIILTQTNEKRKLHTKSDTIRVNFSAAGNISKG